MKNFQRLTSVLALSTATSTGCLGAGGLPKGSTAPVATTTFQSVAAEPNIDAINALNVVAVGSLLLAVPADAATNCYGVPCPNEQPVINAEVSRQLPRLQQLTNLAQAAAESADPGRVVSDEEVATDLQTLRELYIVSIGDLVVDVPQVSGLCYNVVCPEDQARADVSNKQRRSQLATLAEQAEGI